MADDIPTIATSAPDYDEEPVIDIDIGFLSGATMAKTLRPEQGDEVRASENGFILFLSSLSLTKPEEFEIYTQSLAWVSTRYRVRRVRRRPVLESRGSQGSDAPRDSATAPTPE